MQRKRTSNKKLKKTKKCNLFEDDLNLAAVSYLHNQDNYNECKDSEFMFIVLKFLERMMHRERLLGTAILIIDL